jgi:hypothetical protein
MNGYSQEDHQAIFKEMRDVIARARDPYIPSSAAWREWFLGAWQEIGGKREDMLALFREADASAQKN